MAQITSQQAQCWILYMLLQKPTSMCIYNDTCKCMKGFHILLHVCICAYVHMHVYTCTCRGRKWCNKSMKLILYFLLSPPLVLSFSSSFNFPCFFLSSAPPPPYRLPTLLFPPAISLLSRSPPCRRSCSSSERLRGACRHSWDC